jgi:hypothetical protein
MVLLICLILSGASFATPAPITNVSAGVNGTPPYIIQSFQVGSYTVHGTELLPGTSQITVNQGGAAANVDDLDINSIAARNNIAAPNNTWTITNLAGKTLYGDVNGSSNPDFFLFEAGMNDAFTIQAILPGGALGQNINVASSAFGDSGYDVSGQPANNGQNIGGVAFGITDLKDASGAFLSSDAAIQGLLITSGSIDPTSFTVIGTPSIIPPSSDLSGNGKVDMEDFGLLSQGWQNGYEMADLLKIAEDWLLITTVAFLSDPIVEMDADDGIAYNSTLSDDLVHFDVSQIAFSKLNGPGWLTVAANGTLSGTPANSNIGINNFTVRAENLDGQSDQAALAINVNGTLPPMVEVVPAPYTKGLRNPLMGFTINGGGTSHPWATLTHTYIRWNEIENYESDTIDKIRTVCNSKWNNFQTKNIKVIPRVYLHWDGTTQYWPADMTPYDYSSEQFKQRVLRLIERLGSLWDTDPRVAFVEMGIFGKWGEQEQPAAIPEVDALVADAFAAAFKNKLVSVRRNWQMYQSQPFGEYWDSWAHYDQMWGHGNNIALLNAQQDRYLTNYVGGEVAWWGNAPIQPGSDPTDCVADPVHRDFMINSIRWLHCTQLRWITEYNQSNEQARAGADLIQQAFGYRFILEKVVFSPSITDGTLHVVLHVKNEGSAPFYHNWPVEVSLLNMNNRSVVWKQTFANTDIRRLLPGEGWTDPKWNNNKPDPNWISNGTPGWTTLPQTYTASGDFTLTLPTGQYILALAILDPAGNLPSLRFATSQYFSGGRHPVGIVTVNQGGGGPLPGNMVFDDPATDNSLHYLWP